MSSYPKAYFYKKIVTAKLYIDNHYLENIDVGNIASEALFSKFDFIRQFKKVYGKTPYNYLRSVRINKAIELLKFNHSIQDVCFDIGYDSLSSFSNLFKKETGLTPTEYRNAFSDRVKLIDGKPLNYVPGCFAEKNGWKKEQF